MADGAQVAYDLHQNGIAVDVAFNRLTSDVEVPRAGSCDEGPYRGTYTVDGEVVGQMACWVDQDVAYSSRPTGGRTSSWG